MSRFVDKHKKVRLYNARINCADVYLYHAFQPYYCFSCRVLVAVVLSNSTYRCFHIKWNKIPLKESKDRKTKKIKITQKNKNKNKGNSFFVNNKFYDGYW